MNTVDIIILACMIPALVQGLRKGFIDQVTSLISVVLGIWLSFHFAGVVTGWIQPYLEIPEKVLNVISFLLILVAVILVLGLIGRVLESTVKFVMLGWLDKLLGLVLSLIKGALVVGLLVMLFNTLNTKFELVDEKILGDAVLYTPMKDLAYLVFPFFKELLF